MQTIAQLAPGMAIALSSPQQCHRTQPHSRANKPNGWGRADRASSTGRHTVAANALRRTKSRIAASSAFRRLRVVASAPAAAEAARDRSAQIIASSAPFLTDPSVIGVRVGFVSPTDHAHGGAPALAQETQGGTVFKSQMGRDEYVSLMAAFKQRSIADLPGRLQVTILRTFRADSNTVLVRWRGTWHSGGASVEGNSTYKLGDEGVLVEHIDQFQVLPRKDKDTASFSDVFEFALAKRPAGMPPFLGKSLVPAVRLASWEALKNQPDFGGQLIRSEMDVFTDQMMIAIAALGFSTLYLIAKIVSRMTGGPL